MKSATHLRMLLASETTFRAIVDAPLQHPGQTQVCELW